MEILLLGDGEPELEGSEYLAFRHGATGDRPPAIDLDGERRTGELCASLVEGSLVECAHDVADGGIAVALAEMAFHGGIGADVALEVPGRADVALFGESGCRILVAVDTARAADVEDAARQAGVRCRRLGRSGGSRLRIVDAGGAGVLVDSALDRLREGWEATLPAISHADLPDTGEADGPLHSKTKASREPGVVE